MKSLIALSFLLLLSLSLSAQAPFIRGRVVDGRSGQGIPGAAILLPGTVRGTTTSADGTFELPLDPAAMLPVRLTVTALGYESREVVGQGAGVRVELTAPRAPCGPEMFSIRQTFEVRAWSGVRHSPVGIWAELFRWRQLGWVQLPLAGALGYQTNFKGNQQLAARLSYINTCYGTMGRRLPLERAELLYSGLRTAGFRFNSYALRGQFGRSQARRGPLLLLGVGYAGRPRETSYRSGAGASAGLSYGLPFLRLHLTAQATRWPGYWQWQAEASRRLGRLDVALAANAVGRQYFELNLSAGLPFY
jgi:hypothetical protein